VGGSEKEVYCIFLAGLGYKEFADYSRSGTAALDKQLVNMVTVEHIANRMTDSQVPHLFGSALKRQFCYVYSFGPLPNQAYDVDHVLNGSSPPGWSFKVVAGGAVPRGPILIRQQCTSMQ